MLESGAKDKLEQVALIDEQRQKLREGAEFSTVGEFGIAFASTLIPILITAAIGVPAAGTLTSAFINFSLAYVSSQWGSMNGDIVDRMEEIKHEFEKEYDVDWSDKQYEIDETDTNGENVKF